MNFIAVSVMSVIHSVNSKGQLNIGEVHYCAHNCQVCSVINTYFNSEGKLHMSVVHFSAQSVGSAPSLKQVSIQKALIA